MMTFIRFYSVVTPNMCSTTVFTRHELPSRSDYAFYHENGWLLTELVVREEYLQQLRQAVEEVYQSDYDMEFPWSTARENINFNKAYSKRNDPRMDCYLSLHKHRIKAVIQNPLLAEYAAMLMDAPQVRLYRDILLSMPQCSGATTGWHVDKNYWPTCSSDKLTSAWFCLEDCDIENGCLAVVNGSHRFARTDFLRKIPFEDIGSIAKLYGKLPKDIDIISLPHKKGQVSFHSCLLMHCSHPNTSDKPRQSFATVFQDGDNHFISASCKKHRDINFNTNDHVGPKSKDGQPDYHEPSFYPLLYNRKT